MVSRLKIGIVVLSSVLLTTLGILASDLTTGIENSLTALVSTADSTCGENAQAMLFGTHGICVDTFEASASTECPYASPQNEIETSRNLEAKHCRAVSELNREPWRYVSQTQAAQLCARDGKRLPLAFEWYKTASGITNVDGCVLENGDRPALTGESHCVSPSGVHDLVGNVWEWMDETVNAGVWDERLLPLSGYVESVDSSGIVVTTNEEPVADYALDYAWTETTGVAGLIRGGFYGSGSDGGLFAQNFSVSPAIKTAGIGFRCVRDITY